MQPYAPVDTNWCLPSKLDNKPLVWMISADGFIVDVRTVSEEIARAQGFIPYVPDARKQDIDGTQVSSHSNSKADSSTDALYVLDVY